MSKKNLFDALEKRISGEQIDTAYDAMFGIERNQQRVVLLDLNNLVYHPQDPFREYSDKKLKELAESIKQFGLFEPIITRCTKEGKYEILSGKNRKNAVALNGERNIQAIIKDVDDFTAIMMVTQANLEHREKLYPSERAWAYRLQIEAINKQGKRTDLERKITSVQIEQKTSRQIVAEMNGIKESDVQRYIRLTYLRPELLEKVDEGTLSLIAGIYISYLKPELQSFLYSYLQENEKQIKISIKDAEKIKRSYEENNDLSPEEIKFILEDESKMKEKKPFSINREKFSEFADRLPDDAEIERLFLIFLKEKFAIPTDTYKT